MTGQSLTLVVGVPLAAWIGSMRRLARLEHLRRGACRWPARRPVRHRRARAGHRGPWRARPSIGAALSPDVLGPARHRHQRAHLLRLATIYFATFLQASTACRCGDGAASSIFALGNIAGTVLGGSRRPAARSLADFAVAMALSAIAAWRCSCGIRAGVRSRWASLHFVNALGRPSYMAALASVPDEVRGTVLGLNGASASVGWIGAARWRAWISTVGFEGFGRWPRCSACGSARGALANRREISI
jgi:DHA1 family inner membrane transport protein